MSEFTHLHVHTEYSLLDGASRLDDLIASAKEKGMTSLAITDHGVMYGVAEFFKKCVKAGIKPILGCEMYAVKDMTEKTKAYREYAHLVLLAKNQQGYQNLMRLVSMGFLEGFYHKPRIDYKTLGKFSEGLVCLSACLAGDIPQALLNGDYAGAKDLALQLKDMFGDDFYIELQDHGLAEQKQTNPDLIKIAKECDISLVVTNDVHYVNKEDAQAQDVLLCIQTRNFLDDENRMKFSTEEFYLKSAEEMAELFPDHPEAMTNTNEVADKCKVKLEFGTYHMPVFELPDGTDHQAFLKDRVFEGLAYRYGDITPELSERAEYELSVIGNMGFTDYFLITWDFIKFAKDRGIVVGPGRGSAAGSIVAYALRITDIDPIEFTLLFERFLNPERISMPDIDIDFCIERRQEVIDYVVQKYGEQNVAQIITFGTLGAKQAVHDVARVMRFPFGEAVRIAKLIPGGPGVTLKSALEDSEPFRREYETKPEVKELIDMCMKLESIPRHASTHAAGVVIAKKPVLEYVPLQINPKDDSVITQFPMGLLEELGLLKMDFLGLRNLTVIRDTLTMVEEATGESIDFGNMAYDDPGVYALITSADTDGVFQLESPGMRRLMQQLKPSNMSDIMVGISLFRPGPMDSIPTYIASKNHPEKVRYDHPSLEKTLKETYGCIVYQEQVMQIVQDMAGYSLGRADLVRRAMSKKKADVMAKEREVFIFGDSAQGVDGAIKRGIDQRTAEKVFNQMTDFAQYAFNKSHACAYAAIAYQTAYLKVHYKREFMTALLNSFIGSPDKTAAYIQYLKKSGIKVLPPDINISGPRFRVDGESIRFGFSAIRDVGGKASMEIVRIRKEKAYADFLDFIKRTHGIINKKALEGLILAGCFDRFGNTRSSLMSVYERAMKSVADDDKKVIDGQMSLFDESFGISADQGISIPDLKEYDTRQLLSLEKQTTGSYLSGHPLEAYEAELEARPHNTYKILSSASDPSTASYYEGREVELLGILGDVKRRATKDKRAYALATLEDLYSIIDVIVFQGPLADAEPLLYNDNIVKMRGRVDIKEGEAPKIILEKLTPVLKADDNYAGKMLYVKIPAMYGESTEKLINVLKKYPGKSPTTVHMEATKKTMVTNGGYGVTYTKNLIDNLKIAFGEANVVVK
ncbi:MAG: DNA polymerase III subunit alpha [Eubacteriales bacterium]